jgi:hypothetical protein
VGDRRGPRARRRRWVWCDQEVNRRPPAGGTPALLSRRSERADIGRRHRGPAIAAASVPAARRGQVWYDGDAESCGVALEARARGGEVRSTCGRLPRPGRSGRSCKSHLHESRGTTTSPSGRRSSSKDSRRPSRGACRRSRRSRRSCPAQRDARHVRDGGTHEPSRSRRRDATIAGNVTEREHMATTLYLGGRVLCCDGATPARRRRWSCATAAWPASARRAVSPPAWRGRARPRRARPRGADLHGPGWPGSTW